MADAHVARIEMVRSTAAAGDGPAKKTNQPVQRRIINPLGFGPVTRIPIAKAVLPGRPNIDVELARVRKAWRIYRSTNRRDAVYIYLASVFAVVNRWHRLDCAVKNARVALRLQANAPQMKPEPFAIVIFCTSATNVVDAKTRSRWSRVLRYSVRAKPSGQRLIDFVKSNGGLNECARKFGEISQ